MYLFTNVLINQIVLSLFLLVTLVVAFFYGGKIKTMRDYALANRSLGAGVLVITLVATMMDASNTDIKLFYGKGVVGLIFPLIRVFLGIFLGLLVLPKLTHFTERYTTADVMGALYGPFARVLTVLLSTAFLFLAIVGQLMIIGEFGRLVNLPPAYLIVGTGLLITLYTFLGGVRSVAVTDVLQFIGFSAGFSIFIALIILHQGGIHQILEKAAAVQNHLLFWTHPGFKPRFIGAFFWGMVLFVSPPVIQRVLMAKNKQQVRSMFLGFSFIYFLVSLLMTLAGLSLATMQNIPSVEAITLSQIALFGTEHAMISQLAFLIAMFGIIMSTIDSVLNALATLWTHDILRSFLQKKSVDMLFSTRCSTLIFGIAATLVATIFKVKIWSLMTYANILISVTALPFIMGVLGMKGSPRIFLVTVSSFFISLLLFFFGYELGFGPLRWLVAKWLLSMGLTVGIGTRSVSFWVFWFLSTFVSSIAFFITHYLEQGSWVFLDRKNNFWKVSRHFYLPEFSFSFLRAPVRWANDQVEAYGCAPYFFGLFIYTTFLIPYINFQGSTSHLILTSSFRSFGFILATALLVRPLWPKRLRLYFHLFYFLAILYCVPFVNTITWLNDASNNFTVVGMMLSIILLAVLTDWKALLLLQVLGSALAALIHVLLGGLLPEWTDQAFFLYAIGYTLLICLIFVRKKQLNNYFQRYQWQDKEVRHTSSLQNFLSIQQQLIEAFDERSSSMKAIKNVLNKLKEKKVEARNLEILTHSINHFQQIANKSAEYLPLHPISFQLTHLLDNVFSRLQKEGWTPEERIQLFQKVVDQKCRLDPIYMQDLIIENLKELLKGYPSQLVGLHIDATKLDHGIGKKIPAFRWTFTLKKRIAPPKKSYTSDNKEFLLTKNLTQAYSEQITKAHYGVVEERNSDKIKSYVIPIDVNKLRPKIGLFSDEDLNKKTQLDRAEEKEFLNAVQKEKGWDLKLVEKAVLVCKYYHRHQKRKTGEPYYLHPLAVAKLLLHYTKDQRLVIAGLLHDLVEDTAFTRDQMIVMFGQEITAIVDKVTSLYSSKVRKLKLSREETFAELSPKKNPLAATVKVIDRLHNIETLNVHPPSKQIRIAYETIKFFIPMAEVLGYKEVADQMHKKCQEILEKVK